MSEQEPIRIIIEEEDLPLKVERETSTPKTVATDTGRKAASSKNVQSWDFVTVRDPATIAELPAVGRYGTPLATAGAAIARMIRTTARTEYRRIIQSSPKLFDRFG